MMSKTLKQVIHGYKFEERRGWAPILGRVLAGYIDDNEDIWFEDVDLIVASPTYLGTGARHTWNHIGAIVTAASKEALGHIPFDDQGHPAIIKTQETKSMTRSRSASERRRIAENELRPALAVPDPGRVRGKTILVFDDVFTDGSTLREVALALTRAGATNVSQVTLARQPWTN